LFCAKDNQVVSFSVQMKDLPMVRVAHVDQASEGLDAAKTLREFKASIGDVTPELMDRYEEHLRAK
jgi:hypothetical protein